MTSGCRLVTSSCHHFFIAGRTVIFQYACAFLSAITPSCRGRGGAPGPWTGCLLEWMLRDPFVSHGYMSSRWRSTLARPPYNPFASSTPLHLWWGGSTSSTRTTYFAIFLPSLRTRRCSYFIIPVASPQQGAYNLGRSRWLYSFFCDPGLSATRSWWHLSAMLRDTVAPAFLPRSAAHMM